MRSLKSLLLHLLLFVVVEVIFVLVLFREFPETDIFTAIGIGHLTYWVLVIVAGIFRETTTRVWKRFLATYLPVVYHLVIHLWIGMETLHAVEELHPEHHVDTVWLILGTIGLGGLIFRGEWLIHRKYHCETHHRQAHKACLEEGHEQCEQTHQKEQ